MADIQTTHETFRRDTPRAIRVAALMCAAVALFVIVCRVLGPSDLHQNTDQSKTIGATADIVINGRWALPRDLAGEGLKKPPLVNWIGTPFVVLFGWHEWTLKAPAILFGLLAAAVSGLAGHNLLSRLRTPGRACDRRDRLVAAAAPSLALAAATLWLASPSAIKNVYFLRPDIALTATLALGWLAAVRTLDPTPNGKEAVRRLWMLTLWLAAGLAALTKGPVALLVPLYLVLHALLLPPLCTPAVEAVACEDGGWRVRLRDRLIRLHRTGWWWGVPLMLAISLGWLWAAYRTDPVFVRETLLGGEVADRLHKGTGGIEWPRILRSCITVPGFFLERFGAGGALWLLCLALVIPVWRWRTHPLGPAILWTLLITVTMIFFAGRAGSYTAPAYPAAAVLAVYAIARVLAPLQFRGVGIAGLAALAAIGFTIQPLFLSRAAETRLGDRIQAFAAEASEIVGDDTVVFVETGHNPLPVLMGRARVGEPTPEDVFAAAWIVAPTDSALANSEPVLTSKGELKVGGAGQRSERRVLGLYRVPASPP